MIVARVLVRDHDDDKRPLQESRAYAYPDIEDKKSGGELHAKEEIPQRTMTPMVWQGQGGVVMGIMGDASRIPGLSTRISRSASVSEQRDAGSITEIMIPANLRNASTRDGLTQKNEASREKKTKPDLEIQVQRSNGERARRREGELSPVDMNDEDQSVSLAPADFSPGQTEIGSQN
eukprot:CAMPEP_0167755170 /NCGR_PEP_ID=MMETSP0110_2-20121227/8673_1 /TAXON_ID=629695 /ORGANISM="Gymnochlora sp., Strain CCMP2014" /LENGTH=176 /DNA_ID=CAMNT_0007641123 /DNA_START=186 /DNA_END=716 /DNA_ORIENTATION=+